MQEYFKPARVFFEPDALDYPLGKEMYEKFKNTGVAVNFLKSHNRVTGIPGKTAQDSFFHGKNTLVVGIRRTLDFAGCKPSAHYQLPLVTGCPGICEYCYLNTQLGKKPYTRVYVNIEEILQRCREYIEDRRPEITLFESAATSDPIPVEPFSGALARTIQFFAGQEYGRLRFVTKYPFIDTLLDIDHRNHTRIRFSVNSISVIKTYEHRTPPLEVRLQALEKILAGGYPAGVIIAPIIIYTGWQDEYAALLQNLRHTLDRSGRHDLHFELISHRFTRRAKNNILAVFPDTGLPMEEDDTRQYKYGQFGYGKYVYQKEQIGDIKAFFSRHIEELFPSAEIEYMI